MMSKLGYLAVGLLVAGLVALAPAPAFAGCGACGAEKACGAKAKACAEKCAKSCCDKKSAEGEKACSAECQKDCCAKEESSESDS